MSQYNIIEGGFHKISFKQWWKDLTEDSRETCHEDLLDAYENLKKPEQKTEGAGGHDIHSPWDYRVYPGETIKIPTGYSVEMPIGYTFKVYPRSSFGTNYEAVLTNTVGVIDSDYFYSSNEGHMWLFMKNNGSKILEIKRGDAIAQGIIEKYYIFGINPNAKKRDGGFGSTSK